MAATEISACARSRDAEAESTHLLEQWMVTAVFVVPLAEFLNISDGVPVQ